MAYWKRFGVVVIVTFLCMMIYLRKSKRAISGRKFIFLQDGKDKVKFSYYVIGSLDGFNQARMSTATDPETRDLMRKDHDGLFHLVTTFIPFDHEDIKSNLLINDDEQPTDAELEARMAEVTECLQKNLNHKLIAFVHVLVDLEETVNRLRQLDLRNSQKLIIHKDSESPTMKHEIMYATKYLNGKTVIVSHQDNYIGEGWEKVNRKVLQKRQLMYALTRHQPVSKCAATTTAAHCGEDYPYMGSHDTFVFYVRKKFPSHLLAEIDVTPNMSGIENVLIWIFKTRFKYDVMNPCKVLIVYHNHCVSIREMGRERINTEGKDALIYFTDQLE